MHRAVLIYYIRMFIVIRTSSGTFYTNNNVAYLHALHMHGRNRYQFIRYTPADSITLQSANIPARITSLLYRTDSRSPSDTQSLHSKTSPAGASSGLHACIVGMRMQARALEVCIPHTLVRSCIDRTFLLLLLVLLFPSPVFLEFAVMVLVLSS